MNITNYSGVLVMMLKVFEAFSGIGTQRMALKRLGIPHEVVGISEIDKYAIQSYEAIHGQTRNFGDISSVNPQELPDFDLFTYSFPCQDLSIAGKQRGMLKGQTRSGLLYECEKIIEAKRPKYLLLENVKQLVGKTFRQPFDAWLSYLEGLGYTNYWQVLNAKDYGVPQHRERVFVVSILGAHQPFEFPIPLAPHETLEHRLDDTLPFQPFIGELTRVPSSLESTNRILMAMTQGYVRVRTYPIDQESLKQCLKEAKQQSGLTIQQLATELGVKKTTVEHWFRQDHCFSVPDETIWLKLKTLLHLTTSEFDQAILTYEIKPNVFESSNRMYHVNGIAPTLTCCGVTTAKRVWRYHPQTLQPEYRLLSALEYWRLMGVSDEDYNKAKQVGVTSGQLYKQAGNAIVVDVLVAIFEALFKLAHN